MITIQNLTLSEANEYKVEPTIFPDGTSQVWKLPESILDSKSLEIIWRFEQEREIMDLYSLVYLLRIKNYKVKIALHMPYLPYARQDKRIDNDSTFNISVFAVMINYLDFDTVSSVDVHSSITGDIIDNFINIDVDDILQEVISDTLEPGKPLHIVFPDKGVFEKYMNDPISKGSIFGSKIRDQATGNITSYELYKNNEDSEDYPKLTSLEPGKVLIIDDICDGGRTFIETAKALRAVQPDLHITLFTTHGLYSKGKDFLLSQGIDDLITTNSLIRNSESEYKV